eukprot:NODE_4242_length_327_cov_2.827338_g4160_i0.p4 GENE.NODE_4242_length_327_cov_2.827338_g4160_i0~~NODE_4242_length_327_cov_2.827338_g4160_i0.p4  ORF type:complete len:80 (+),score=25.98 NODE_4242_length_327_cov_2.827338_g4160_i0:86-325(+)
MEHGSMAAWDKEHKAWGKKHGSMYKRAWKHVKKEHGSKGAWSMGTWEYGARNIEVWGKEHESMEWSMRAYKKEYPCTLR